MKFVLIPPGEFQMGFSQAELDTLTRELKQAGAGEYDLFSASTSGPQHPVRITKPFYMSAHEVTVAQYRKFIDEAHYMTTAEQLGGQRKKWSEYLAPENPDPHPVLGVSWTDTEAYCKHRSAQEGVTYRLPSEAEWEYACRAGTTTLWSFGVNPAQIGEYAVTAPEGTSTQPVGSRKPNSFGMFDMYGNAEEWCLDWHIQDFYATSPTDDPVNLATPADTNSGRVARGGGTVSLPWQLRSSTRRWDFPSTPVNLKGFRVVISGDLKKAVPPQTGWHGWPADAPKPAIAPFNAEQAKKHQEEWAAYLKVPVEYTNSIGMKFRLIPPGEFLMGAPQEEIDELVASNDPQNKVWEDVIRSQGPQHRVVLTQPFYVGVHEVTQGQYQRVVGTGPATPPEGSEPDLANQPEKGAVWGDAVNFTIQLSELEKLPASYLGADLHWVPRDGTGYRLPSESQWEFAARAGTMTRYWSGSTKSDLLAVDWVAENSENRTHAVGEKPANPFGLFDVHGNAIEWTENQFDPAEYTKYQSIPVIDPPRRLKSDWHAYVARGGANDSWGVLSISSAFRMGRSFGNPSIAPDSGGFRVVLSVDAVKEMLKTEADPSGKKASQDSPHAGNPLAPTAIWSAPVNLGSAINTPAREANPSLTSDELLIVFTRGEELFEARRASRDEPFAPATKLAGPLPSAKFLTSCLSGDGLQLVLSAIPPGGNAQDVMIATRTSRDEPFGQPVALPQSINAPGEDRHPVLSPDGLILALTSVRGGQQTGGLLIFTRPNPTAEFNPTPTVDARLQGSWSVINSFSSDGRGLLKTTMADNVETITWHTRTADSPDWSEGQPLPAPFDAIKFGAPFISTDGNTIYFHSRYVPDGQGDLDLWMSRRTMKTP